MLNDKNCMFNPVKKSGHPLFFRESACYSKHLNNKKYLFNTVQNIRETLFFRARASCSKIMNVKSIYHTAKKFWATLGKPKLLKTPECITYIQYSEKFQGSSVFQGKRRLLKIPE